MKRVLFIAAHRPDRSPSQRFRFEQYFDFLSQCGFQCDLSFIVSAGDDVSLYSSGNYLRKSVIVLRAIVTRFRDVLRARSYDLVFVQREGFMLGTTLFERLLKRSCGRMVFDFDDSIWIQDVSDNNRNFLFLKNPSKTVDLIKLASRVIAGNQFLGDFARQYNPNVSVIPTTIDTGLYKPLTNPMKNAIVTIGWSGSFSTIKHFQLILPALLEIKKKYGDRVAFEVIGDTNFKNSALHITGKGWKKETELADLHRFDIGLMPLPDDEWSKGKCGLKGLQYMALGIPTIMSPIGVNTEIIEDGQNGMLAQNQDQWVHKLSVLVENEELRRTLGQAGRKTVVDHYSVESQRENYLKLFTALIQ